MPKMRTKRAAAKRFKLRQSGSVKRKRAFHSHILTKKTTKRCRRLRQRADIDAADLNSIKKSIPAAR